MTFVRLAVTTIALACLSACGGGDDKGGKGGPGGGKRPPMMVGATVAALGDYRPSLTALGTVTPLQSVAVRTRVDGQITAVLFQEGATVSRGQPLFRLDDRAVRAQIAQDRAALASAQATAAQAAGNLKRAEQLVVRGFVSKATLDANRAAAGTGNAGIAQARAAIAASETALSYLTVRAPVSGRTGEIGFKVGATVRGSDPVPLVTVNQLSPITVRFAVPPEHIQTLRTALRTGGVTVTAKDNQSGAVLTTGRLNFLDNNVDPNTGNLAAKAEFDNRRDELWPGALVSVDLPVGAPQRLVVLPEAAIQNGRDGSYVWTIGAGNKVAMTPVQIAGRAAGQAYLAGGVTPGTKVVSDALAKLKAGDPVRTKGQRPGRPGGSSAP